MPPDPTPQSTLPPAGPEQINADALPGPGMLALTAALAAPLSALLGVLGTVLLQFATEGSSRRVDGDVLVFTGAAAGTATALLAAWAWWKLMRRVTAAGAVRWRYRQFVGASLWCAMALGTAAGAGTHLIMQIATGVYRIEVVIMGAAFGLGAGFWLGLLLAWPWAAIVRRKRQAAGLLPEDADE